MQTLNVWCLILKNTLKGKCGTFQIFKLGFCSTTYMYTKYMHVFLVTARSQKVRNWKINAKGALLYLSTFLDIF